MVFVLFEQQSACPHFLIMVSFGMTTASLLLDSATMKAPESSTTIWYEHSCRVVGHWW